MKKWSDLGHFKKKYGTFGILGYNMGFPIHFPPSSDEIAKTPLQGMEIGQKSLEMCKTKF